MDVLSGPKKKRKLKSKYDMGPWGYPAVAAGTIGGTTGALEYGEYKRDPMNQPIKRQKRGGRIR